MVQKLIIFIMLLLPSLGSGEPLSVFVSVLPQKTFVEKIGGNHVKAQAMVRPGNNPHTYDPTPRQIRDLTEASLYIRTGIPFEDVWLERLRSANPHMQVLDARLGIDLRAIEHHDHEHEAEHEDHHQNEDHGHHDGHKSDLERDPHIWTSPPLVKRMAANIRDALIELDPANSQDYKSNYDAFATELDGLDSKIRAMLENVPTRKFMVFHPAWGYFADTYGLMQIPIEKEGKEPGARALTALIQQAKDENVKVILVQPQFSKRSAEQVARAIGGRVVAIDPLSADYLNNLHEVARLIAEAASS
jgi:zinc transport system substrate-binding protein